MAPNAKTFEPIRAKPGLPLYESVKEAMISAIHRGDFAVSQKLPSTKELSQQFEVSLVTTHRALQELETTGLISRVQGRGTFVNAESMVKAKPRRISVGLQQGLSLADFYHSRLIEGIHNAASANGAEISIVRVSESLPANLDGHLVINPMPEQLAALRKLASRKQPLVIVGVRESEGLTCVDVDNVNLMEKAVKHLASLGHERIGYLGGDGPMAYREARRAGFRDTLKALGLPVNPRCMVLTEGWCPSEPEKVELMRCLTAGDAPSAIVASGYYYALGVYEVVNKLGITVPETLSIVSVDDPPSAAHLNPPLTTMRQPVEELGHTAVHQLMDLMNRAITPDPRHDTQSDPRPDHNGQSEPTEPAPRRSHLLRGELVVRDSTAPPKR